MKRYLILTVAVLAVVAMTLGVYAQPQGGGQGQGRMRGGFNRESQQNAVAAIEAQLAKLKASMEAQPARPQGNFQDMSDEERNKWREQMMKQREEQAAIVTAIDQQVMVLKGRQLQTEHEAAMEELQAIQVMAASENAPKTAKHVEELIAKKTQAFEQKAEKLGIRLRRGRGQGGPGGQGQGGQGRGQRGNN